MKKQILLAALLCIASLAMAQNIEFKETTHNFGDISENGGKVTHVFEFTNTGNVPLVVSEVRPSCGCTSKDWTKEPVAPSATGKVFISYDPKNRPGAFNKSVKIISNSTSGEQTIYISGNVLGVQP